MTTATKSDVVTKHLPTRLYDAYDWTASAGEIELLRALRGAELLRTVAVEVMS